jgi:hypothetical protein
MFSTLNNFEQHITQVAHPEQLRDILCLLFDEMEMRGKGFRNKRTGFETATDEELHLAFYRTANQMIIMWSFLRDQL